MIARDFTQQITATDPVFLAITEQFREILRVLNGELNLNNVAQLQSLGKIALHSLYFSVPNTPMQSLRLLVGGVNGADAATLSGTGWTATRNGVGDYTITYAVAFSSMVSVVATLQTSNRIFLNGAPGTGSFGVLVLNAAGAAVDSSFFFFAIGVP